MWKKPIAEKAKVEELDLVALNEKECMEINGGADFNWLGGCIVIGGACNFNTSGGLSWGVCSVLGISFGNNKNY